MLMQEGLGEAGARGGEIEAALQLRASAGLCTGIHAAGFHGGS